MKTNYFGGVCDSLQYRHMVAMNVGTAVSMFELFYKIVVYSHRKDTAAKGQNGKDTYHRSLGYKISPTFCLDVYFSKSFKGRDSLFFTVMSRHL